MAIQLTTRGPVQVREYVADDSKAPHYDERAALVTRVRIIERGQDIRVELYSALGNVGGLTMPASAEDEIVRRCFGEVEALRADRAAFQILMQAFEDAVLSGEAARVTAAWRRAFVVYDTMAADLVALSGLPVKGRGAA